MTAGKNALLAVMVGFIPTSSFLVHPIGSLPPLPQFTARVKTIHLSRLNGA